MGTHADYSNYSDESSHQETLQTLIDSYEALSSDLRNYVSNLANCSSLLWHAYRSRKVNVNWLGFYIKDPNPNADQYLLGPFQGKVACQIIKTGHGVCGSAAKERRTMLVKNVNEFPGHIACDGETKSEIVVPVISSGTVVALIDLDCLDLNGFDETDQEYLEKLAKVVALSCDWNSNYS